MYIIVGLVAVVLIYLGILYIQYKNVNDEIKKVDATSQKATEKP